MTGIVSRVKNKINQKFFRRKMLREQFENGYASFLKTGVTPEEANQAMINLYCLTNGKFNEEINKKQIIENPPQKVQEEIGGVIGKLNKTEFSKINDTLNKDGYVNFDKKLSKDIVTRLYEFALKTPALTAPHYDKKIVYDEKNPVSEIYRFDMQDLVNNSDIQALIMDPALINVARNYLGSEPVFDFPAMWWSTCFLKEASSEAAQLFHFDMDRIKWLKIFIYLNDVTPENGPHSYIKGSHLQDSKPQELLNRGYVRIKDEELVPVYKKEAFITVCAEAGSIFAGDTKCWHKGNTLKKGHRLAFEFEYTTSMFGSNYPKLEIKDCPDVFKEFCKNNKRYTSNFKIN